jgi:pyruvate formate lyase activating enzyme
MVDETLIFDRKLCDACGECVGCCPEGALEVVGNKMEVVEVAEEVLRDIVFYQVSGGGVTFSGGEPLVQPAFVSAVSKQLKTQDVHVAVDTAGNVPWDAFEAVLPFTDLILYDLKLIDRALHEKHTGVGNQVIMENARKLADRGISMIVRLIIVPGINDSSEEIQARVDFVRSLGVVEQIDLLPYHKLGVAKYERLGKGYLHHDLLSPENSYLEKLGGQIQDLGFQVTIGG